MVSVGASGAIFGLFAVSVMTRLKLDLRRLLEAVILGNFVVKQVREVEGSWLASVQACIRGCISYSLYLVQGLAAGAVTRAWCRCLSGWSGWPACCGSCYAVALGGILNRSA